ncbi:MAG: LysR family transcriptional regulator [Gammaproteobacteria bacterium]|nr:LysR family transcriptional regulator [Gammaproteobacteria bacterium]
MEFNELKAFTAVAETLSFSRAADQLHITQPAVSKRIASLEEKLAVKLFDRIGRNVNLTEAGEHLLARTTRILQDIEELQRSISGLDREPCGTLIMATSHHIGLRRLPPVLKAYNQQYNRVKLDIRFMDSESACAAVEQGNLELAIVTLPPNPAASLTLRQIWCDNLRFVASPGHPFTRMETVNPEDLVHYPAVLASWGTYTRDILERAIKPTQQRLQLGMTTNYLETLKMLASIGLGWSLLPETMTRDGDLAAFSVAGINLTRALGVVHHRGHTLSNSAQAMLDTCLRFAEQTTAVSGRLTTR